MKKSRFTETQILGYIKEYEAGKPVADLCREAGITKATFYNWNTKYSGISSHELKRLKALEEDHRKLQQMYAELAMDNKVLKDVIAKKF